jgi:hypothetical protein
MYNQKLQAKPINFVKGLRILRRRAHLTSDYVKVQLAYLALVEKGENTDHNQHSYFMAQHFLWRQIRLCDIAFNSLFLRLEKPA